MGFFITSQIKQKGILLPSGVYVTINHERPLFTYSSEDRNGVMNYTARCYMFMYPSKNYYLANRRESSWFNDAVEETIPLTYEQYIGNSREAVYNYFKSKLTKQFGDISFKDDLVEAQPITDILSSDKNITPVNYNSKYYIIGKQLSEIQSIKASNKVVDVVSEKLPNEIEIINDVKLDDKNSVKSKFENAEILVLQFTADTVVKHDAKEGIYAPIHLNGGVDFNAKDDDTLSLMFDGDAWVELSKSVFSAESEVKPAEGEVKVEKVAAESEVKPAEGEVKVEEVAAESEVKPVEGEVKVEDVAAESEVKPAEGEVKVEEVVV